MSEEAGVPAQLEACFEDGVLRLVLRRAASRNALSLSLVNAMIDALDEAAARRVHSAVIEAEDPVFCAGLDLGDLDSKSDGDLLLQLVRIETLLQKLHHAPFQTIAFAKGAAFGAGADMLAACRERVATADLKISFPGIRFGIFLGTRRLVARVGAGNADRILGGGQLLSGQEAHGLGLVTQVASAQAWPGIREAFLRRGEGLEPHVAMHLGSLIAADSRAMDMADLVRSASRPGLKQRIAAYVGSMRKR